MKLRFVVGKSGRRGGTTAWKLFIFDHSWRLFFIQHRNPNFRAVYSDVDLLMKHLEQTLKIVTGKLIPR